MPEKDPTTWTAAVLSGVSVADAIQWLTVLYLVLQVAYLLAKWRRESRTAIAAILTALKNMGLIAT